MSSSASPSQAAEAAAGGSKHPATREEAYAGGVTPEEYTLLVQISAVLRLAFNALIASEEHLLCRSLHGLSSGAPGHSLLTTIVYAIASRAASEQVEELAAAGQSFTSAGLEPGCDEKRIEYAPGCLNSLLHVFEKQLHLEVKRPVPTSQSVDQLSFLGHQFQTSKMLGDFETFAAGVPHSENVEVRYPVMAADKLAICSVLTKSSALRDSAIAAWHCTIPAMGLPSRGSMVPRVLEGTDTCTYQRIASNSTGYLRARGMRGELEHPWPGCASARGVGKSPLQNDGLHQ
eukprot:3246884-Amphidinium_carterae.1